MKPLGMYLKLCLDRNKKVYMARKQRWKNYMGMVVHNLNIKHNNIWEVEAG